MRPRRCVTILVATAISILCYAYRIQFDVIPRETKKNKAVAHDEHLTVYKLPDIFVEEPAHLTPIDPTTLIELGNESIDAAHRKGKLHFGGILYVIDADNKLLLIKRASSVMTCPNTWSIVGEHSIIGEYANDLPRRALDEELGLSSSSDQYFKILSLTEFPLYYIRHYGARNGNRIDRQLTYLWLVKLPKRHEDMFWKLDHEVAGHKWITLNELDRWLEEDAKNDKSTNKSHEEDDGPPNGDFCHQTIRSLLRIGVDRLKVILPGNKL